MYDGYMGIYVDVGWVNICGGMMGICGYMWMYDGYMGVYVDV